MQLSHLVDESNERVYVPAHLPAQRRQHDQGQAALQRDTRRGIEFKDSVGVVHAVEKQKQRLRRVGLTAWYLEVVVSANVDPKLPVE